nr:pilin [Allokutzneria sp. NRRL B-24872]
MNAARERFLAPSRYRLNALLIVGLAAGVLLVSEPVAHAGTTVLALAASVSDVLNNLRNWLMGLLAGLATVFLTIGGVRYVMGGGDPGEVEKAKTAFKSAGWGYGLATLAPLIVEILKGIVGA